MDDACASRRDARFFEAVARLPTFYVFCTFEPVLAAMIHAVFFTDHIIKMFIRFTFCGTATTFKTGVSGFTGFIVFAILICATK